GNPHFEEADFRAAAEAQAGRSLAPREVSRFWFAQAFQHMREHPAFAARAMFCKLVLFWNDFEISDNQDQYLLERDSWVLRLPLLGFGGVAPLALLGVIAAVRTRRAVRLLGGFVILYCASVVAFFIFSRYRIQVVPALLPLAAVGAAELVARIRDRSWTRVAAAAAVVAGAGLLCFHRFGIFSRDNELVVEMRLRHLGEVYETAGMPDRAIDVFQEAVRGCPTRCPQALEKPFAADVPARVGGGRRGPEARDRHALSAQGCLADHRLVRSLLLPARFLPEPLLHERRPERAMRGVRPAATEQHGEDGILLRRGDHLL